MTTIASVGLSRQQDALRAGSDAAAQAMGGLDGPANLVIAFTTERYDQEAVVRGIRAMTDAAPLIGCCGGGIITTHGPSLDSVAVMALRSESLHVTLAMEMGVRADPHRVGHTVAEALAQHLTVAGAEDQYAVMLTLLEDSGEAMLAMQSASDVLGPVCPLVGGNSPTGQFVFVNEQVRSDALAAALLRASVPIGIGVGHGWKPVGRPMVVTRSVANVVYELDGRPAAEVYQRMWWNESSEPAAEKARGLVMAHPLGLPQVGGEYLIRDPIQARPDGAIEFAAAIPENAVAHMMSGDRDQLFAAARAAAQQAVDGLAGRPPAAVIVFDCVSRLILLGDDAATEISHIRDVVGHETPLIGMFSFGEIAPPPHSRLAALHNKTVVVCVLAQE